MIEVCIQWQSGLGGQRIATHPTHNRPLDPRTRVRHAHDSRQKPNPK